MRYNRAHEVRAGSEKGKRFGMRVAGLDVEINCLYGTHFYGFKPYFHRFSRPDITISISQEEIDAERRNHPEITEPDIEVNDERVTVTYDYGFLEPFVAFRKMADAVIAYDTFVMHGAVVAIDGNGYMFTAPSGTGKTTRVRLWKENYPDSTVINGDKPFIKILDGIVLACGSPWCGKEGWNDNAMVPLKAIFLLERGEENRIEEIGPGKAFPTLLQQTYWPVDPGALMKTVQLLKRVGEKTKIYRFCSLPTAEAVRLAYEMARPR